MSSIIGFMFEQSVQNTIPMCLAALFSSYIAGPFLINLGMKNRSRAIVYSVISVLVGLWSYSTFHIPERNLELIETFIVGAGMFIYTVFFVGLTVFIKNYKSIV